MTFREALLQLLYGGALNALLLRATARLLARVPCQEPSRRDAPDAAGALERIAAAAVIAASLIVALVTVGGTAGFLDRRAAMLSLAAILWLAVELATRTAAARLRANGVPGGEPAGACGAGRAGLARVFDDATVRAAAVLVAVAWIPLLGERITLPPVAWDALTYHLRFPVLWLQTGHLVTSAAPVGDASHTYYPLAGEMFLYWGLLSTGTDLWSALSQIPFAFVTAAAIASLALRCGSGVRLAILAALCWLGTPGVVRQSVEPMVDIDQTCFFVCMLLFAARRRGGGGRAWLFLSAAALGLLVGTKYTGAIYAVAALPLLVWTEAGVVRRGVAIRREGVALVASVVLAAALGGYAYARNLAAGGNPFLPLQISWGGLTLLHGPLASSYYFGAASRRLSWTGFFASGRALLDAGPLLLPLLLTLPLGLLAASQRRSQGGRLPAFLALAGLLGIAIGGAFLPYREHRYFYPVTAVAWCLAAALAKDRMGTRAAGWLAIGLLAIQAPLTLFYWGKDLVVAGVHAGHAAAAAFGAALALLLALRLPAKITALGCRPSHRGLWLGVGTFLVPCLILVAGATSRYQRSKYDLWYRYWSTRYPWNSLHVPRADYRDMAASWRFMEGRTVAPGATVAYAGTNIPYPLAGARLDRRVLFVPRNENGDASFYDWGSAPPDPLSNGTRDSWSRNVQRLHVEYLCVYRETPELDPRSGFPIEQSWADADRGRFTLLWSSPAARIYRVGTAPEGGHSP